MMQLGVVKSGKAARPRSADRGQAASLGVESASTQSAAPGGSSLSAGPSASDPRITPPSTTTPGAGANTASGSAEAIHLAGLAHSARPFQPVRIRGTYHGGANTFLRLQRWDVNTASRMESRGLPGQIQVTGRVAAALSPEFAVRGAEPAT